MADAIISMAERLVATYQEQIPDGDGVEEFVNLWETVKTMRDELVDADNRRFKDQSVNDWLSWLETTACQMEDLLDKWDYIQDQDYDDMVEKMLKVKAEVDQILEKKEVYNIGIREHTTSSEPRPPHSTSSVDSKQVHGRDSDKDTLLTKLTATHGGVQLLSIAGMPGVGKTTLAQLLYNDTRVKQCFNVRIWIHVSDHFDEAQISKEIIDGVKSYTSNPMEKLVNNLTDLIAGKNNASPSVEMLVSSVADSIKGKKFLLVLDDVWTEDYSKWESLKKALDHGGAGSKILVTTRNERVAETMGAIDNGMIHRLGLLSDEDNWAVMKRAALFGRSDAEDLRFDDIGRRIIRKCKGLPLAAKALGRLLHSKSSFEEWENVVVTLVWERDVFPRLLSSYNQLPPTLKRCFSYCAVFPKESKIEVAEVIEMWMALGYLGSGSDMEHKGREWFDALAKHSLFQEFQKGGGDQIKSFEMHEIVHDFARFIRTTTTEKAEETCQICHPLLVSGVREYRTIFLERTPLQSLCHCLATTRVLRTNYRIQSIPRGIANKLIHLRWLDLSNSQLSEEEVRTICKLCNLQTLLLGSCGITELPSEIASLVHLRHLNLMGNDFKELSESICSFLQLQILNVDYCYDLCCLPQGIHRLVNLKHFYFEQTKLQVFPEELGQLSCLNTLTEFRVGSGWNKWGVLKNLDQLRGSLKLWIKLRGDEEAEEIHEAEMKKKVDIQEQLIIFEDEMAESESLSMAMANRSDVIEALELPPNLQSLKMWFYKGSKLPTSKLHQLKHLRLYEFINLQALPPLGLLPNLEEVFVGSMKGLQMVGREFLGIAGDSSSTSSVVSFPKLKELKFYDCGQWREWEDLTAEEEESAAVTVMPCLITLHIISCAGLLQLPYHLLRKAASMEELNLNGTDISVYTVRAHQSGNPNLRVK